MRTADACFGLRTGAVAARLIIKKSAKKGAAPYVSVNVRWPCGLPIDITWLGGASVHLPQSVVDPPLLGAIVAVKVPSEKKVIVNPSVSKSHGPGE